MKNLVLTFSLIVSFSRIVAAHGQSELVKCEGVKGLRVMTDYTPESKPFINKNLTDLYTYKSDDGYMTHIVVDDKMFENSTPEIRVDILNSEKVSIKKYRLKQWILDKSLPNRRISKVNFSKFITAKISDPYDKYANLKDSQKSKTKFAKVPFDAKISITSGVNTICSFDFKYGSISEY